MSEDGWDPVPSVEFLIEKYAELDKVIRQNPVTKPFEPEEEEIEKEDDIKFLDIEDRVCDDTGTCKPRFFTPSLQVQRNMFVRSCLRDYRYCEEGKIQKLAVMGCGELSFERFMFHELSGCGVERVLSVDIDPEPLRKGVDLLDKTSVRVQHLIKGNSLSPVLLEQYLGDITTFDRRFADVDCVCSTEVIEHIPLEVGSKFMHVVLGYVQPWLFILSTPNHEFNEAFEMKPGEFRHDDHKFEFSRAEFKDWLDKIMADYPEYKCNIKLVGQLPGFDSLGGATQFAVIERRADAAKRVVDGEDLYEKVNHSIVYHGLFEIMRRSSLNAFKQYLAEHPLLEENLITEDFGSYWNIDADDVIELFSLPSVLMDLFSYPDFLEIVHFASGLTIFYKEESDGSPDCLTIPSTVNLEDVMKNINKCLR